MVGGYQIIDLTDYPIDTSSEIRINNTKLYKQVQNADKVPLVKLRIVFSDSGVSSTIDVKAFGLSTYTGEHGIAVTTGIGMIRLDCNNDGSISLHYVE